MDGRSALQPGPQQGRAASKARQPVSPIRGVRLDRVSGLSEGVPVIAEGGAPSLGRSAEDATNLGRKCDDAGLRNGIRNGKGVNPGCVETLVGVDVSNACHDGLVEEC